MLVDLLWTQSCLLRKLTQQGSYEVYPVAAHTAGSSDIHPKVVCQSFVKEVGSCGALGAGWYTAAGCQPAVKVGFCVALGAGWYTAAGLETSLQVGFGECHDRVDGFQGILTNRWMMKMLLDVVGDSIG